MPTVAVPDCGLVEYEEIPDSYTLVPIDQPSVLAAHLREFIGADRSSPVPAASLQPGSRG